MEEADRPLPLASPAAYMYVQLQEPVLSPVLSPTGVFLGTNQQVGGGKVTDPKDGDKGRVTPQTVRMELLREVLGICTWIEQTRQVVFSPPCCHGLPLFFFPGFFDWCVCACVSWIDT